MKSIKTIIIFFLIIINIILLYKLISYKSNAAIKQNTELIEPLIKVINIELIKNNKAISVMDATPKFMIFIKNSDCKSCLLKVNKFYNDMVKSNWMVYLIKLDDRNGQFRFYDEINKIFTDSLYYIKNLKFNKDFSIDTPLCLFIDKYNNIILKKRITNNIDIDEELFIARLNFILTIK